MLARASFGLRGANLPAMIRAAVACAWFGIQTWIGGQGIFVLLGKLFGGWAEASEVGGQPWTLWVCFVLFWALELAIIYRGMEALRRFENWAAPFVIVGALVLLVWVANKAAVWTAARPALPAGLGCRLLAGVLPVPDGHDRLLVDAQPQHPRLHPLRRGTARPGVGQTLGLPTTMTLFALLSVFVTSGSQAVYGAAVWDPVELAAKTDNVFGLLFALVTVLVATISVNIAANVVSPAYDLANLAPKFITFRTGALITGVVGVVIMPWKLTETPELYIFTWLGLVGGLLGTVAGILIADYWVVRRTRLDLADLYTPGGRYWYTSGWNVHAVVAFVIGGVLAVGGSHSAPGKGPFPEDGLIPFLKPLADYGWAVGLAASLVVYVALTAGSRRRV